MDTLGCTAGASSPDRANALAPGHVVACNPWTRSRPSFPLTYSFTKDRLTEVLGDFIGVTIM